jgi:hypothetical protein
LQAVLLVNPGPDQQLHGLGSVVRQSREIVAVAAALMTACVVERLLTTCKDVPNKQQKY